ncbi:MAG: hypothetical protein LBD51_07345 [Bifidobacteriaceae bacterium]|jgi:hypothetical protein|nr:hypothetical protein [Bifidobacteriaceae bacterium]
MSKKPSGQAVYAPGGPPAPFKTGPRPAVIIWGVAIALIGVWVLALSASVEFSGDLALIAILALAGLTLVASSIIAALRRPKR